MRDKYRCRAFRLSYLGPRRRRNQRIGEPLLFFGVSCEAIGQTVRFHQSTTGPDHGGEGGQSDRRS